MAKKKRTYEELATEYGLTVDKIKKLKGEGVNVYDPLDVIEATKAKRHRASGESVLPNHDTPKASKDVSLGDMKAQLSVGGITIDEIKALKEAGLAHKALTAAEKEEGKLIPISEVEEAQIVDASAVRAMVSKWRNDLPPKLVGLDEVGIQKVMLETEIELLTMLSDSQSEFWKGRPKP